MIDEGRCNSNTENSTKLSWESFDIKPKKTKFECSDSSTKEKKICIAICLAQIFCQYRGNINFYRRLLPIPT